MKVILYGFSKRENSTSRPSGGSSFNVRLKENCSIISPSLLFEADNNVVKYNYAYIPDFNRYYFISSWTTEGNKLWRADLTVDVLATYRNEIGNSTQYVVRSASRYNGEILDELYPATADVETITYKYGNGNPFNIPTSDGIIIANIQNQVGNSTTGLTQVALMPIASGSLSVGDFKKIFAGSEWTANDNYYLNPIQFISDMFYLPLSYTSIVADGDNFAPGVSYSEFLILGNNSIALPNFSINAPKSFSGTITLGIPKHPQASQRGMYLNTSRYSSLTLYFYTFGVIEIDADAWADKTKMYCNYNIDISTGKAILKLKSDANTVLQSVEVDMRVPVSLFQQSKAVVEMGLNAAGSAVSAVGNIAAATQNPEAIGGAISSSISAVGNIYSAAKSNGSYSFINGIGSFIDFQQDVALCGVFRKVVDDDNEDRGRPLCEKVKINTLSGYVMTTDADFKALATADEIQRVKSYMNGGFFYE